VYKFLPILFVICSCSNHPTKINNDASKKDTIKTISIVSLDSIHNNYIGYYESDGDSLIIPPFGIQVDLSVKADKKIKEDKETIIVAAYFTGQTLDTTSQDYMDNGTTSVASATKELVNTRIANFEGIKISKSLYDSLIDKDIEVSINIYSGRKSSQNNLLDGGFLSDRMSYIKGKILPMKVKLIYNDD